MSTSVMRAISESSNFGWSERAESESLWFGVLGAAWMERYQVRSLLAYGSSLAFLFVALAAHAQENGSPSANMVENGGFEEWGPLDPNAAKREDVSRVNLIPPGFAPAGWLPVREFVKGQGRTGTMAMDEKVRHSGARSVRIENGDMRDITYVLYSTERFAGRPDATLRSSASLRSTSDPHNIRPNRRYLVRWWVKGENIAPDGTGPILMMHYMSVKDGKSYRTDASEAGDTLPKGSFDWQHREFTFITDEYAKWAAFTLQLRWTTGAVWYDDVEMFDTGPVVLVKTY